MKPDVEELRKLCDNKDNAVFVDFYVGHMRWLLARLEKLERVREAAETVHDASEVTGQQWSDLGKALDAAKEE